MTGAETPKDASDEMAQGQNGVAALLVALAKIDDDYAAVERARILSALEGLFAIDGEEAGALLAAAEAAHSDALDIHGFTLAVKTAFTVEERVVFLEAAWRVVLTDQRRDPQENTLMRRLAGLLGVEDRLSMEARRRVEAAGV